MSICASAPGRPSIIQGLLAAASTQTAGPGSSLPYRAHSSMKNLTENQASQNCPSGDTFSKYPLESHQTSVTQTEPASQGLPLRVSTWVVRREAPKWRGTALKGVSGLQHPLEGTWNLDAPPSLCPCLSPVWAKVDTLTSKKSAQKEPEQAVVAQSLVT